MHHQKPLNFSELNSTGSRLQELPPHISSKALLGDVSISGILAASMNLQPIYYLLHTTKLIECFNIESGLAGVVKRASSGSCAALHHRHLLCATHPRGKSAREAKMSLLPASC